MRKSPGRARGEPSSDTILQGLTTAVVVLNAKLEVLYLNSAAETLLGVSRQQAAGRPVAEFFVPPEEIVQLCRRVLDSGVTFSRRELTTRLAAREAVLDCRVGPVESREGGLLLELFDTQRDRHIRREAELVAQQRVSRRIIRQLAHEVKNPLGGLRGAAQLLERQLPAVELKAYTKVIIEEADRLAALVDGILRAGNKPRPAALNLHEITEYVASLIEAEKPARVALVRDYDPSLPAIEADKGQLVQAYLNLARNGLQAIADSGGRLILRTRALTNYTLAGVKHRLVLSIEVEDDGPGVPEELKETIFYPLVTGRSVGTGLGLTIAQDLVTGNGGLVEFTSRPGCTVFQMRLPVARDAGEART